VRGNVRNDRGLAGSVSGMITFALLRKRWHRTLGLGGEVAAMYVLRVLRVTAGEVRDVLRARTPTHGRLRDRLVGIALATLGFDLVCAVLAFLFEHHQKQTQIESFGSAFFWTTTQMLTVSSNVQNPISFPGRALDIVMEIYAITVIGSLAGALGAFLIKRGEELDAAAEPRSARPATHG
jgi:hypothetical protein